MRNMRTTKNVTLTSYHINEVPISFNKKLALFFFLKLEEEVEKKSSAFTGSFSILKIHEISCEY